MLKMFTANNGYYQLSPRKCAIEFSWIISQFGKSRVTQSFFRGYYSWE